MSQQKLLRAISDVFHEQGVPFMLTGELAFLHQSKRRRKKPKTIPCVIEFITDQKWDQVDALHAALETAGIHVRRVDLKAAVQWHRPINLSASWSNEVASLTVVNQTVEYERVRFSRRVASRVKKSNVQISHGEDTVLDCILRARSVEDEEREYFFKMGASVYMQQNSLLDKNYLESWAEKMSVQQELLYVEMTAE